MLFRMKSSFELGDDQLKPRSKIPMLFRIKSSFELGDDQLEPRSKILMLFRMKSSFELGDDQPDPRSRIIKKVQRSGPFQKLLSYFLLECHRGQKLNRSLKRLIGYHFVCNTNFIPAYSSKLISAKLLKCTCSDIELQFSFRVLCKN